MPSQIYFVTLRSETIDKNMIMEKENYLEIHVGICPEAQWYQELMERMKRVKVNRIIRRCHVTALFLKDDGLKDVLMEAFNRQLHHRSAPRLTFDKLEVFTSISGEGAYRMCDIDTSGDGIYGTGGRTERGGFATRCRAGRELSAARDTGKGASGCYFTRRTTATDCRDTDAGIYAGTDYRGLQIQDIGLECRVD